MAAAVENNRDNFVRSPIFRLRRIALRPVRLRRTASYWEYVSLITDARALNLGFLQIYRTG
jgi:hypothetical protein